MERQPIILKGTVPSKKNSKRRVKRGAVVFHIPSAAHEAWHEENMWLLRPQWNGKKPIEHANITIVFYPGDKRKRDLTNGAESVMDILVDAGILLDDNWYVVPTVSLMFGNVDKDNPHAEVYIHETELSTTHSVEH